ncbi:DNA -binding domain-containing protein [Mesorhizobium abyssinicae]|uniref:DNA -binding domain-containing protein n=1 Tax=Mesorhizobium abyssinicae TaxID=1209958 RepID=UPI0033942BC9
MTLRIAAGWQPFAFRRNRAEGVCVLQVLDGSLAAASHQEIAIALYGRGRVQKDWAHPDGHLRDRVRRAYPT